MPKASGPDGIPVVGLKKCEPELSYILFKMCLKKSCFVDCWKVSSVVPVFKNIGKSCKISSRFSNTGLVSSRASLTAWGEGASLTLVAHPSSDGIAIKMPYGVDVLHQPASHSIFSYWVD